MSSIEYILAYITPYLAMIVLLGGVAYQVSRWRRKKPATVHLSLFPRPQGKLGRLIDALIDMFTLKGLFKVNKLLWAGGFIMHVGLLLLILGHIRTVTDFTFLWNWLDWGPEETHVFSAVAGLIAAVLFTIPLFYLLGRRWSGSVKILSTPEDFLILFLLMGIAFTGSHMRFLRPDLDQEAMRQFMQGLYTFSWKPFPGTEGTGSTGPAFLWHFTMVQLLMIYFPFSKLMHTIGGIFNKMVMRS